MHSHLPRFLVFLILNGLILLSIRFLCAGVPVCLLGRPTLVGKALSFTHEHSFCLFYQSTVLSSHAEDGHQMYFGGSFVGKASTIAHPSPNNSLSTPALDERAQQVRVDHN